MAKHLSTSPRRSYQPATISNTALPFIAGPRYYRKKGRTRCGNLWDVPHTDDYDYARMLGSVYAAHFTQYLRDNPHTVGHNLLGRIATDMDFHDASAKRGYWIGFFSFLEYLLAGQAVQQPVFDCLRNFQADMAVQLDWPAPR